MCEREEEEEEEEEEERERERERRLASSPGPFPAFQCYTLFSCAYVERLGSLGMRLEREKEGKEKVIYMCI